jgi:hypothetical protein
MPLIISPIRSFLTVGLLDILFADAAQKGDFTYSVTVENTLLSPYSGNSASYQGHLTSLAGGVMSGNLSLVETNDPTLFDVDTVTLMLFAPKAGQGYYSEQFTKVDGTILTWSPILSQPHYLIEDESEIHSGSILGIGGTLAAPAISAPPGQRATIAPAGTITTTFEF